MRGAADFFLRALPVCLAAFLIPATPLLAKSSAPRAEPSEAHGLIVQLREAPSHAVLARERAAAAADTSSRAESERSRRDRALRSAGVSPRTLQPSGRAAWLLRFDGPLPAADAERLAQRLREQPEVEWVVPNERERRLQAVPNDPLFGGVANQWWLQPVGGSDANAIEARLRGVPGFQSAWARGVTGSASVPVAVLDTGIVPHAELEGRLLPGYDFVSTVEYANDGDGRDADPGDPGDWVSPTDLASPTFSGCEVGDSSWHGTINANLVGVLTNDGRSVAAALWDTRIVPVRVAGKCGAEVADIVDGMRWAAGLHVEGVPDNANPARIVNISFGGSAACNAAYRAAIDELRAVGAVVVAPGGNDHAALSRPANCAGVVGVVALNRDGFKSNYSNFGAAAAIATVGGDDADADAAWSGLVADSGLLTLGDAGTTTPGGAVVRRVYGSSFSAPLVSSAMALMLAANPALSAEQLVAGLRASARPHVTSPWMAACSDANPGRCLCTTSTCGAGILDAEQALLFALAPDSYVAPAAQGAVLDNEELRQAAALGPDRPANPVPPPPSGGGGGAASPLWLLGLLLASAALGRVSARRATRRA